jgi:glycosyltransferase involved in cell wall biosynthesis
MRIAQVTLRFDAPGGVETTVREISRRLVLKGEQVAVYASDLYDEGRWERREQFAPSVDGVPVHRFPVYKRLIPGLTMPLMVGLVEALNAAPLDLIHAHSHRYGHVLEAAAVARARELPLVVSAHYHPPHPGEPAMKRGLLRLQDQAFGVAVYRTARAIIVETDHEAQQVAEFAPEDRIRVIPPGIDLGTWRERPGASAPEGLPERFLLFAGRIASNKGLVSLVEALALVPPAERWPLVLMGRDWGYRQEVVDAAARAGVSDRLVWLDHIDDPAVYRAVYRRASAFVLPSEYEAFGLVLLEAMAVGLPVVATAVGGVPEVLEGGRAGRLVKPGDPNVLAEAIRAVAGDPKRTRELASAASQRVELFSWERAVSGLRELYGSLTAG